jgi:hypothetical protein
VSWIAGGRPDIEVLSLRRLQRKHQERVPVLSGRDGGGAAKLGDRPVDWVVVEKHARASFGDGGSAFLDHPLEIASFDAKDQPVSRMHHDGCRPDLDVARIEFAGRQLLNLVVDTPRLIDFRSCLVQFSMRSPQPTLRQRRSHIGGSQEHHLFATVVEELEGDEQIGVRGGSSKANTRSSSGTIL